MEPTPTGSAQPLPDHLHAPYLYAGFWRRTAALIIDSLIVSAAGVVVFIVLAIVFGISLTHAGPGHETAWLGFSLLVDVILIVGQWLYFALFESSARQATPGKMALGLAVTDGRGQRIGFGRATGRYFGKILSGMILCIGYMLAGWTARKQALHDLIADCCVVRRDGLAAFERGETGAAMPSGAGMPGWAIALVVVGACFFMLIPVAAILAAIAIPAYQNYLVRAQVAEGMQLANSAQTAVAAYVGNSGATPADNAAAGLADPDSLGGKYVSRVQVDNGEVVVTFGGAANRAIAGEHLVFRPYGSSNAVRWHCGSPDIEVKYLPLTCRD